MRRTAAVNSPFSSLDIPFTSTELCAQLAAGLKGIGRNINRAVRNRRSQQQEVLMVLRVFDIATANPTAFSKIASY